MPWERQIPFLLSLQSPLTYFRRTHQEQIPSNSHYLSVLYVSLSLPTECKLKPTFLQELELHWLISTLLLLPPGPSKSLSTGATLPGGWVCSNLQSWTCFGNELSSVTLFFVQYYWVTRELQMYLIIGTVEMIAKKPETVTFPWVVISQAGGGKERWFMTIH